MNPNAGISVSVASGVAFCGAAWFFAPTLRSDEAKVEDEVAVRVERARRLVHQYEPELVRQALLLEQLRDLEIEPDDPQALADEAGDTYQQIHTKIREAFEPGARGGGYGNIAGQVRDGLRGRDSLVSENERLLQQALSEVDAALAVQAGNASGRSHAQANALKATILYCQGMARSLDAAMLRFRSEPHRRALAEHVQRIARLQERTELVADSGIEEQIAALSERIDEEQRKVDESQAQVTELGGTIREFEQRLADAEARRDKAAETLRRLQESGLDFSDPQAVQTFRAQVLEVDGALRTAEREVSALLHGDFSNAEIDASGDYLAGRYVEKGSPEGLTISHGLDYYRQGYAIAEAELRTGSEAVAGMRGALERLTSARTRFETERSEALGEIADARERAGLAFDEMSRLDSEAEAAEEEALRSFERSAQAARQGAAGAQEWVNQARERMQGVSPAASDRSAFKERENDGWLGGYLTARVGDALLARAWVFQQQYAAASTTAAILASLPESEALGEADPAAEEEKAAEAREAGIEEVKKAMAELQRAHRDADRHWTLVAQAGGANDLLTLFGLEPYRQEAIEAYRNALQGREEASFVRSLAARLRQLEER